jgi:hypothetical protein
VISFLAPLVKRSHCTCPYAIFKKFTLKHQSAETSFAVKRNLSVFSVVGYLSILGAGCPLLVISVKDWTVCKKIQYLTILYKFIAGLLLVCYK